MAIETQVQRKLVDFIVSELHYEEKLSSVIGHNLLIEDDVVRFLQTPLNIDAYKRVLKAYGNDPVELLKDYCQEISDRIYQGYNVAVKIRRSNFTIRFKGEIFYLFYPSGSDISDNSHYNIFSVVEELRYESSKPNIYNKKYRKRFDMCFFVNGMFFSMLELKHITSGQGIEKAHAKIIGDYFEAIKFYSELNEGNVPTEGALTPEYRDFLKVFESSIHVISSDSGTTHVSRNLRDIRPLIRDAVISNRGSAAVLTKLDPKSSPFNILPVVDENANYFEKIKSSLTQLYSKISVERELLFYNYIERNTKGNAPKLISPRPKQKFGVDKTINRIVELYENEHDQDFISNEMSVRLRNRGYSEDQIASEVKLCKLLTNDGHIYSILKQYAAGFGKTKIMSWEAIMLNEMPHPQHLQQKLFNKIILLSDRIDLKQQMAEAMTSMPTINDAAWDEADTVEKFVEMLSNNVCRIIVVNVQKFNFISAKLNEKQRQLCSSFRIAFIIDEIHRSHNGTQNEQMQLMFDRMGKMAGSQKKNLLIGLTATASDTILRRFGEVAMPSSKGFEFVPYDSFTMTEAIAGGYVLNPLKNFIPIHVPVFVESMDEFATDAYKMPSGKDIYQDEDYIKHVVNHSYRLIKAKTFPSVFGRGKAMYVADSIDSAIQAFHLFKELIDKDKSYTDIVDDKKSPSKKPKVYVVFSKSSVDQSSRETPIQLNCGLSEKQLIKEFKLSKNAIIVVVDKLQTGFDEPTLHTLVLNTERKGIEMVQTLCRVNRTAKGKHDCVIFDYSMREPKTGKSKNELNSSEAFHKYAGIATTTFNVEQKKAFLKQTYDNMISDELFSELFSLYLSSKRDAEVDLTQLQPKVLGLTDKDVGNLLDKGRAFFSELTTSNGIFTFADTYKNKQFPDFFRTIRNIFCDKRNARKSLDFEVSDIEGFLVEDIIGDIDGVKPKAPKPKSKSNAGESGDDNPPDRDAELADKIKKFNEYNELTESMLEQTDQVITGILFLIKDSADTSASSISSKSLGLVNYIKSQPYSPDYDQFIKMVNRLLRSQKRSSPFIDAHHKTLESMVSNLKEFYYNELANML